jgi:hypothetical protein
MDFRQPYESVQAHAHLLGIFFELQLGCAGKFDAGVFSVWIYYGVDHCAVEF